MATVGLPMPLPVSRRDLLKGLSALTLTELASRHNAVWAAPAGRPNVRVYYSSDFTRSNHPFDTTRKAAWIADSLARRPMLGLELAPPRPLTEPEVAAVHDPAYVAAIRTGEPRALANSPGLPWNPNVWPMVLASNGGAVEAAKTALRTGVSGSLSSGIHHARRDRGNGFCTFNGLVLAARAALHAGARRILILDLDAHCGGGTFSLIQDLPAVVQVDIAVNRFDRYRPTGAHALEFVDDARQYLPTLKRRLDSLGAKEARFDLCLYNAGMDAHEGSSTGGLSGITYERLAERERLVFEWCAREQLPIAFVLAGGYSGERLSREALVALHRLTLEAAASTRVRVEPQAAPVPG